MELQTRAGFRSQITKIVNEATEYLKKDSRGIEDLSELDTMEEDLSSYLQRLTTANANLNLVNKDIQTKELEDKNPEKIAEYEDAAAGMLARLQIRLAKIKLRIDPTPSCENSQRPLLTKSHFTKLPKLQLKRFSGDYQEWIPFWENFRSAVHENESLSGVEKFNFLQSVLTGNAAKTIVGFTPSDACYDGAISLLQEEYGDTEKLIDKLMQTLMGLPTVHRRTDAQALRQLYNTVMACSRSLTALGVPSSHYYIMLKTILLKCMPNELRIDYHRIHKELADKGKETADSADEDSSTLSFDGDKQVKNILRFLKQEVESIERAAVAKSGKSTTHYSYNQPTTAAGLLTPTSTSVSKCFFCKSAEHSTRDCDCTQSIDEKKQMLKKDGRCFRCTQRGHTSKFCRVKGIVCKNCKRMHSTVLCGGEAWSKSNNRESAIDKPILTSSTTLCSSNNYNKFSTNVFLQTARVFLSSQTTNRNLFVRLIIDGGSQKTYIREDVANKLKLPIIGFVNMSVIPFGNKEAPSFQKLKTTKFTIKGQFNANEIEIVAVVVPEICLDTLPAPENYCSPQIQGLYLADSNFEGHEQTEGLSILIGADYFWEIVTGKYKRLAKGLTAVDTVFGWTLQGPYTSEECISSLINVSSLCSFSLFENMWNMELLGIRDDESEMKTFTTELQTKCIRKTPTRYEAVLPWKQINYQLETNRENALSRLYSLMRRLSKEQQKLLDYDAVMRELISSGCAERVPHQTDGSNLYYMPHCAVYRPEKSTTKIRIVFDASAHAPGKLSLNDCLWTGSNLLPDILKILLHFRLGKIGLVADIEKAFLQIALADKDRDSHRFLWFADKVLPSRDLPPIQEFRMTRVTFGVTSSPFLLSATIDLHLQSTSEAFPNTCSRLRRSFYMDDLVTSVNNQAEAELFYQESTQIMDRAWMNLRKWVSNDGGVRGFLGIQHVESIQTVLGVRWNILSDDLSLNIDSEDLQNMTSATKRNVLKIIARIYDPLGFMNPVVIRLKILFQSLWRQKLTWDQPIGDEFHKEWSTCMKDLDLLGELSFPRWLGLDGSSKNNEMHIFADASPKAFGAVAFLRIEGSEGEVQVRFVCSKVRVAPLKESKMDDISLPKLELAAALVAARLCAYFQKCHLPCENYYLWTDSQITLHWIHGDVRRWKPFVFNRVKEIQDLTVKSDWRHCSGLQNPADLVTRGVSTQQFAASLLWQEGPYWLKGDKAGWPSSNYVIDIEESTTLLTKSEEDVIAKSTDVLGPIFPFERISHWKKLLRVGKPIPRSSTLQNLNVFLDNDGFLRLESRLQGLDEPLVAVNPIILPRGSALTRLIAKYFHELSLHGGVNTVLARMRERFWMPAGRQLIKKVIAKCPICKRMRGKPGSQPFAPLPLERLVAARPFETVGVDFAGPLYTPINNGESSRKVYIMIFSCAVVRALHLELVLNLTTESCLLAIRRFLARRGCPNVIYSDNAKTFKKAAIEVKTIGEIFNSEVFHGFLSNRGIIWRFSVERAPWWGGFWERMVKSVKDILKITIWKAKVDIDELHTLLTEAERIINMRPLTYISNDPLDLSPLTPDNFLTGISSYVPVETGSKDRISSLELRTKWIARLKYTSLLWKRWKTEYLGLLRSAHHSNKTFTKEIRPEDVVLVYDAATPRIHWKLAIVDVCFPGRDGKVRAAEVRFGDGKKLRRAVQHLYPLEICDRDLARAEDVKN